MKTCNSTDLSELYARPEDFALGSPEIRAAARALLECRRPTEVSVLIVVAKEERTPKDPCDVVR